MRKIGLLLVVLCAILVAYSGTARADSFKLSAPALSGDMVYDLRASALGYGPSYTIGSFGKDQMCEIKGMWVIFPDPTIPNKLGVGLALSIPKALKAVGVQNIPDWFTLSVGVLGLIDFQDKPEASIGIYATILNIPI